MNNLFEVLMQYKWSIGLGIGFFILCLLLLNFGVGMTLLVLVITALAIFVGYLRDRKLTISEFIRNFK
jgi:uncharacterized membrane protein